MDRAPSGGAGRDADANVDDDDIVTGAGLGPGRIVWIDEVGTVAFVISAIVAAIVFSSGARLVAVVVALVLFSAGVVAFLWSYWTAVQRSRTDNIAVAQLYFLVSGTTPRPVRRTMNLLLLVQVVVGLATAIARSTTDGHAGSTLAFGILVPMYGLGLNGLWCSKFGSFAPRAQGSAVQSSADGPRAPAPADGAVQDNEMEQNSHHG